MIQIFIIIIAFIIGWIVYKRTKIFKEDCDLKDEERKNPTEEYSNPNRNEKGNAIIENNSRSKTFTKQNEKEKNSKNYENKQLNNENEIADYSEKSNNKLNEMEKKIKEL